ncbi:hypothetical protein [Pseudomonas sp. B392_1p]|uniref:hypothetical protein n=1 Tax=Pseudomonas sp. B392_1p TaxID=3457507 RepID=UPI003FD12962
MDRHVVDLPRYLDSRPGLLAALADLLRLALSLHKRGKLLPRQPVLIDAMPSGHPLDISFADQNPPQHCAIGLYFYLNILIEYDFLVQRDAYFMSHSGFLALCCVVLCCVDQNFRAFRPAAVDPLKQLHLGKHHADDDAFH